MSFLTSLGLDGWEGGGGGQGELSFLLASQDWGGRRGQSFHLAALWLDGGGGGSCLSSWLLSVWMVGGGGGGGGKCCIWSNIFELLTQ